MTTKNPEMNPQPRPPAAVVGENLKRERKKAGLTQQELADKSGILLRTIQRAEAGTAVENEALVCLAEVLGVTVDLLQFDFENPPADLKAVVDEMIAQMTGTGPWRHVPVHRVLTLTEAEGLINLQACGYLPEKAEDLSMAAKDIATGLLQTITSDLDGLDLEPASAWECAKSLAADLEALDLEGGALLIGKLDLTYQARTEGSVTSTSWPMFLLLFVPKDQIKPTAAFDLRILPKAFKERNPSTWSPIPAAPNR